MYFDSFFLIVCLAIVLFVVLGMRRSSSSGSTPAAKGTAASTGSNPSRTQMVEDIKMTKTSRVVDQVAILEELSADSPNFRQYCELVGTSQRTGGVIAPYSRREVAYYEIRCYRIENHGSGDVETLVAHEKSFDPFYFVDSSCDTPVYVNIESFGDNVMLINSTNHIEGPNSEFAKAVSGTDASTSTSTGYATSYSIVGALRVGVVHGLGWVRRSVRALVPGLAPAGELALADGGTLAGVQAGQGGWARGHMVGGSRGASVSLASAPGSHGPGGGAGGHVSSGRGAGRGAGRQPMPSGLGSFLGTGTSFGYSNVPRPMPRPAQPYQRQTYRRYGMGDVMSDMITGMVLTSVLDSMAKNAAGTSTTTTTTTSRSSFRGYRLVEDVVPLGNPIYCIGELYKSGTDVYMGRSLAKDYPTSYFATKPETEVLTALGA